MPNKKPKHFEDQNNYRMSHLSEDEKELAVTLYKAGIDFNVHVKVVETVQGPLSEDDSV